MRKRVVGAALCGLALMGSVRAEGKAPATEGAAMVTNTLITYAVVGSAKACFAKSRLILTGYELAEQGHKSPSEAAKNVGAQLSAEDELLVSIGFGMSKVTDNELLEYYESCLDEAVRELVKK